MEAVTGTERGRRWLWFAVALGVALAVGAPPPATAGPEADNVIFTHPFDSVEGLEGFSAGLVQASTEDGKKCLHSIRAATRPRRK